MEVSNSVLCSRDREEDRGRHKERGRDRDKNDRERKRRRSRCCFLFQICATVLHGCPSTSIFVFHSATASCLMRAMLVYALVEQA